MTCPRTVALGAYVLGALEREERAELEAHLDSCAICREELDRLAPLPGLLSRLSVEEAERLGAPEPDPAERPAPLRGALAEVARERRRSRLVRVAAVAAVLALAVVLAVGNPLSTDGDGGAPAPLTASAVDARTGVKGVAELTRRPWGTRVQLRLTGVRPGERCRLVARGQGGHTEVAATWRAGYLGTADVPGALAIPRHRLSSLEVVGAGDRVLVRMPVNGS
jgi:anti-sigma factor RsiW